MKTEYIVGGVVLAGIVGYFLVSSEIANAAKSAKAVAPPPQPSGSAGYNDYKTVQILPSDQSALFGFNSQGVRRDFKPGDSYVFSPQENHDFQNASYTVANVPRPSTAGYTFPDPPMGVFYASENGVATRYLTPQSLI